MDAFARSLTDPATWDQHYDLCGPDVFTLGELVEYTARLIGTRVRVVGLNDRLSRLQSRILGVLPGKPFSYDNYLSMQLDSVCDGSGLAQLGITPRSVESMVPLYLGTASQRSHYQQLRRLA